MELEVPVEELQKSKLFIATPMYGGQCFGSYTKSILDLSRLCQSYNISCQFSFLFNESLITRARNYLVDEFLRSDHTHLMFIDSDIDFNPRDVLGLLAMKKPIIGGPYPKKSLPGNAQILTEDGPKTLKWLVSTKYTGKVLAFNETAGTWNYQPVIGHSVSPKDADKPWVRIGRHGRKSLKCTADHECAVVEDVLAPHIVYCPAIDTAGKYIIKYPSSNGKNSVNPLYTPEQLSCLLGTLIGDGCVDKYGYLRFGHSEAQSAYLHLKQSLFGGKIGDVRKVGTYKGTSYFARFLDCPRNAQVLALRTLCYPGGKKTLTPTWLEKLTDIGLAFWFMDDATANENGSIRFCTESFTYDEHKLLQQTFMDKWGVTSSIQKHGNSHRLYVGTEDSAAVFAKIAPFVMVEMNYKLPDAYRGIPKFDYSTITNRLSYAAEYVEEVVSIPNQGRQYDIGVETNPNFVVNGHLVHNCIAWENVYDAVRYEMVPNDNRHKLADFAGDFVFNAVPGTTEIKLNEPAEVLEIGTGFMLIERSVLTKFTETYPQYWYNPDHNRSTSFDGSRKIFQYFQAEIEPDRQRYLSEDYWFCQKARQAGISVWLCPWMQVKHHGTYIYGGSIPAMATVVNERTKRNDPVPATVLMETPTQSRVVTPDNMTFAEFSKMSSSKRREVLELYATKFGVGVGMVSSRYQRYKQEWAQTRSEETMAALLAPGADLNPPPSPDAPVAA